MLIIIFYNFKLMYLFNDIISSVWKMVDNTVFSRLTLLLRVRGKTYFKYAFFWEKRVKYFAFNKRMVRLMDFENWKGT